jgi:hypothetical protein
MWSYKPWSRLLGRQGKPTGKSIRFFTADGVEVGNFWDLAGAKKEEMVLQLIRALAREAARRDHLAAMNEIRKRA